MVIKIWFSKVLYTFIVFYLIALVSETFKFRIDISIGAPEHGNILLMDKIQEKKYF